MEVSNPRAVVLGRMGNGGRCLGDGVSWGSADPRTLAYLVKSGSCLTSIG